MLKGGLGNLMKQAQAMQENMRKAQEELAKLEVTGSAGGGMVTIVMTCRHDVRRVTVDPSLLKAEEKEVLEDLVAAATNDAVRKAEQVTQEKMSGLTAGLGLPGGFNLPF
jgi:DNA-binding YbaB/EbfC family protein